MHALEPAWEALRSDFESACSRSARAARRETVAHLHGVFRRLRAYGSEYEWIATLMDGATAFSSQAALFLVENGMIKLRSQRPTSLPEAVEFPVASARAFASVVESRDSVVALKTAGEVGETLAGALEHSRIHLFPITNVERVAAILLAPDDGTVDVNALELIAGMGAAVLERKSNQSLHARIAPAAENGNTVQAGSREADKPKLKLPPWSALNAQQRVVHAKAQRFARVAVAEMQLAHPTACRAGMDQGDVYNFLQTDIDKARERFRRQFLTMPSMVDYLHLELVRAIADGDDAKLGAEYPGPLV